MLFLEGYYADCRQELVLIHPKVSDEAMQKLLWDFSEDLIARHFVVKK
jgi:hypothetical protein